MIPIVVSDIPTDTENMIRLLNFGKLLVLLQVYIITNLKYNSINYYYYYLEEIKCNPANHGLSSKAVDLKNVLYKNQSIIVLFLF